MTLYEEMSQEEFDFMIKKYKQESRSWYAVMNRLMMLCVLVAFVVSLFYYYRSASMQVMYTVFFIGICFLICFMCIVAVLSYRHSLWDLKKDVDKRVKKIVVMRIRNKSYIAQNNTYHFYIYHPGKSSIEVDENTYNYYEMGDEINIEMAKYSNEYFGYY